jgi:hypothetical protein
MTIPTLTGFLMIEIKHAKDGQSVAVGQASAKACRRAV